MQHLYISQTCISQTTPKPQPNTTTTLVVSLLYNAIIQTVQLTSDKKILLKSKQLTPFFLAVGIIL